MKFLSLPTGQLHYNLYILYMTHRHVRTVYNCRKHQKEICKNVKLGVQIYLNLYLVKSMPYYVCVDSLPKAQLFSSFFPLSLDKESVYNPKAV